MGTRSTTHFKYKDKTEAIIYRHWDGYPEGAGADILNFIEECSKLNDSRFNDPCYLAARYVVFLAKKFTRDYKEVNGRLEEIENPSPLSFLSVGVVMADPGDIEYRYVITASEYDYDTLQTRERKLPKPKVQCFELYGDEKEIDLEAVLKAKEAPKEEKEENA